MFFSVKCKSASVSRFLALEILVGNYENNNNDFINEPDIFTW